MSVHQNTSRRGHQRIPSPSVQRQSITSSASSNGFSCPVMTGGYWLPFGDAAIGVAPDWIAPILGKPAGVDNAFIVYLKTQARQRQRRDEPLLDAEIVLVAHIVEQLGPFVVVNAYALLLQHRVTRDEIDLETGRQCNGT